MSAASSDFRTSSAAERSDSFFSGWAGAVCVGAALAAAFFVASFAAVDRESRYFEIPLGRVELAEYLCVDRSALTRELAKMKDDGLIDYDRNCFRIL